MYLLGITLPDTAPNWVAVAVSSIPLLLVVGGWLLARESRNKFLTEIVAASLLVAATVIPSGVFNAGLFLQLLSNIVHGAPVILILVGLAWVADKGIKAVPGAALALVGLALLFGVSHF